MNEYKIKIMDGNHSIEIGPWFGNTVEEVKKEAESVGHKVLWVRFIKGCKNRSTE